MTRVRPEEIEAFAAGELSDSDAERVLAAIVDDPEAGRELEAALQARALGAELASMPKPAIERPAPRSVDVEPAIPIRRRRGTYVVAAAVVMAAAVALYLATRSREPEPTAVASLDDQLRGALAGQRAFEPRLSWAGADRHRAYDTNRSAGTKPEQLSFELLARIEALGDPGAMFAAHVLVGNLDRAKQQLGTPTTANGWSDQAALRLLARDPVAAFLATGHALALAPAHVQATWNRALATTVLGLDRLAASLFDQVAARAEPGWSDEARVRAQALRAQRTRRETAYKEARAASTAMLHGGPVQPVVDLVAAFPGVIRLDFYDALRTATTADRVRELLPVARGLDAKFGGDVLTRHAERAAGQSFAKRPALVGRYVKMREGRSTLEEGRAVVEAARGDDDLLLGAMLLAGPRFQVEPRYLDEYLRLATAQHDPWFDLLALEQRALSIYATGDVARAELELRKGKCDEPSAMPYRCQRITRLQAHFLSAMSRMTAADHAWQRSHALVVQEGTTPFEQELLQIGASIVVTRDTVGASQHDLALAYLQELELGQSHCTTTRHVREDVAQSLINRNLVAEARALMASEPPCDAAFTVERAFVLGQLVTEAKAIEKLRAEMAALRTMPSTTDSDRAVLDHVEARLLVAVHDPRGRELLAKLVASSPDDVHSKRVRSYSYALLIEEAGQRGDFTAALRWLAAERGASLPDRCVVGASNEAETVFAVRGASGATTGSYRKRTVTDPPVLPADLAATLAGCETLDIFARAPFYGQAELVPATHASRFRTTGPGTSRPLPGPTVIVANVVSPPELGLAPLSPFVGSAGVTVVEGDRATPQRVLDAIKTASFVEIHAHALVEGDEAGSMVVVSADPSGRYALGARELAGARLVARPVVVLAACEAGRTTLSPRTWGLADAFLAAGASAVIASSEPIGDAGAVEFFAAVRDRIAAGAAPAAALRDVKQGWRDPTQRRWMDRLVVFQ